MEKDTITSLDQTIGYMISADYKDRFKAEFWQLSIRASKLEHYIKRIKDARAAGAQEPPHDCSIELLEEQLDCMYDYCRILLKRGLVEHINLYDVEPKAEGPQSYFDE